jgi:O-antigen/teichoic acid export membrane protein
MALPIRGLLRREMAFGALAFINTATALASATATILLALAGFSFMSFAWATMVAAGTTIVLSFYFRPNLSILRPAFRSWRDVLSFGGYNGASHVINQTYETLPQLVLGGILPPAAVGLYNRALLVSKIPQMIFLTSVFSVAFPALAAEIRKGHSLKEPYLRALGYITVLYWPALVLIALLANPVVSLLLGQQWLSVIPLLQIMAVAHLPWFPVILTAPVLLAVSANRDRVLVHLVARPISAVVLCAAAYFDIMAMALSQLVIVPYVMVVVLYFVRRHIAFRWRELAAAIWKSAVVTVSSAAGPAGVVAFCDSGFDLPIAASVVAVLLAGIGWFAGVFATRHPINARAPQSARPDRADANCRAIRGLCASEWLHPARGHLPEIHGRQR